MAIAFLYGLWLIITGLRRWRWKKPSWENRETSYQGYRSARAMKSKAAWDAAQACSGKWSFRSGLFLCVIVAPLLALTEEPLLDGNIALAIIVPVALIVTGFLPALLITETMLKRDFDETGNPVK